MPIVDWPTRVRQRNLDAVVEILHASQVSYLVHCPREMTSTAAAVRWQDRDTVLQAIEKSEHLMVAALRPDSARLPLLEPGSPRAKRLFKHAESFAVVGPTQFESNGDASRLRYACEVEFWSEDDQGCFQSPRWGKVCTVLPDFAADRQVAIRDLGPFSDVREPSQDERRYPSARHLVERTPFDIRFPVDAVFTWVEGSDPEWLRKQQKYRSSESNWHAESTSEARYLTHDELRYSIRSIQAFAPWIRKIYIVADNQRPDWLGEDSEYVQVVNHSDIFSEQEWLPVFNSHAIESQLHRIPTLANHFLYLNDDMFLGKPVAPQEFFSAIGDVAIHLSINRAATLRAQPTPVDAAFSNGAALLLRDFGSRITATSAHCPYSLRVDIMNELENRYSTEWSATGQSRFRSWTDLSPTSSFFQYYAWFTGRAFLGGLSYSYTNVASPQLGKRLTQLLANQATQAICLNDSSQVPGEALATDTSLGHFFSSYFPLPSRVEDAL